MNPPKSFFSQQLLGSLKFILPFLVWLFVFRDFVFGRIAVNMDTNTIYSVTKFYFNNLLNGVVPLWDPFVLLGTPFYAITICNLFNPVTQGVALLKLLGVNYYDAFIIYIVLYYFLGTIGFYCLTRTVLGDRRIAYLAFLLLLFSGIGTSMFNQFTIVELFVPAVWFFVFFVRLVRHWRPSDGLGLAYSAMIAAISYLPFYFATLLVAFIVLGALVFLRDLKAIWYSAWRFIRGHGGLVVLCALGFAVACAPLLVYKAIDASGDVVSPGRHCAYSDLAGCYERTLHEEGGMSYAETSQSGGLAERVDWRGLFVHLDKISYGADQFFFIPLLGLIVVLLSAFVAVNRTTVLLFALGTALTLLSLADVTPVHRFFYEHVVFFKYFRNLFFFEAYIIPLIILLMAQQLQQLLNVQLANFSVKKAMIVWTLLVHAGLAWFLVRQDGVIITSYLTVAASWIVWTAWAGGLWKSSSVLLWAALAGVSVLQPFEVYHHYALNAAEFQCELPKAHVRPQFSWRRPTQEVQNSCKIFKFVHYETFYDSMAMKDGRGFIGYPASVTRGAFLLSQWVTPETLIGFAQYKFYLTDHVFAFLESPLEVRSLETVLAGRKNAAYINGADAPPATWSDRDWGAQPAIALEGPSPKFEVLSFDVNHLKLRAVVTAPKFLIYTDSWTKYWEATVNGRPQKLWRTDAGFKGLWLKPGENVVEFRYHPPGGGWVYLAVTSVLMAFALGLLWMFWKDDNWPWMWENV